MWQIHPCMLACAAEHGLQEGSNHALGLRASTSCSSTEQFSANRCLSTWFRCQCLFVSVKKTKSSAPGPCPQGVRCACHRSHKGKRKTFLLRCCLLRDLEASVQDVASCAFQGVTPKQHLSEAEYEQRTSASHWKTDREWCRP